MRNSKGQFVKGNVSWSKLHPEKMKANSSSFEKGQKPWNAGLTKETDDRVGKYSKALSETNKGKIPWNKDKKGVMPEPWNKDKTKATDSRIKTPISAMKPTGYGYQYIPYKEWERISKSIRKRDNHVCVRCGATEWVPMRAVLVHHIDGNRQNNVGDNLVSVCPPCHVDLHRSVPPT